MPTWMMGPQNFREFSEMVSRLPNLLHLVASLGDMARLQLGGSFHLGSG